LRQLDPDIAAAERDQVPRRVIEFERLDMRQRGRGFKAAKLGDGRVRSEVEKDLIGGEQAFSALVQPHLQRLRRHKTCVAADQLSAGRLEILQMQLDFAADHVALATHHCLHVGHDGASHDAKPLAVTREMRHPRAPDLGLARHAGDVGAGAADPAALDEGGSPAGLRQMPGDQLAPLSASEHQDVEVFEFGHEFPPSADRCLCG